MTAITKVTANIYTVSGSAVSINSFNLTTPQERNYIKSVFTDKVAYSKRKLSTYPRLSEKYLNTSENVSLPLKVLISFGLILFLVILHQKFTLITWCSCSEPLMMALVSTPCPWPASEVQLHSESRIQPRPSSSAAPSLESLTPLHQKSHSGLSKSFLSEVTGLHSICFFNLHAHNFLNSLKSLRAGIY